MHGENMPHNVGNPPTNRAPVNRLDVTEIRPRRHGGVGYVVEARAGATILEVLLLETSNNSCQGVQYDGNGELEVFTTTVANGENRIKNAYKNTNGAEVPRLNAVESELVAMGLFPA